MMDKKPTTLESVVRSPRFHALLRAPTFMLGAEGWVVLVRIGDNAEQFDKVEEVAGHSLDGAVRAAALRISALDAAALRKPAAELTDNEALNIYEEIFDLDRVGYDDDEQRLIADEMRAVLAADNDEEAYKVIAWWDRHREADSANRRLVAEMRAKYRGGAK